MSVASTVLRSIALCVSSRKALRSSSGTMRSSRLNSSRWSGPTPNTRSPSIENSGPPWPLRQSKLPMRAKSCARASRDLLRSSSTRVRDARSR